LLRRAKKRVVVPWANCDCSVCPRGLSEHNTHGEQKCSVVAYPRN
jgi:hypothetical protein